MDVMVSEEVNANRMPWKTPFAGWSKPILAMPLHRIQQAGIDP
jgi:hypothetical protein